MHPVQIYTLPLHTKFRKMKEPKEIYFYRLNSYLMMLFNVLKKFVSY